MRGVFYNLSGRAFVFVQLVSALTLAAEVFAFRCCGKCFDTRQVRAASRGDGRALADRAGHGAAREDQGRPEAPQVPPGAGGS